MDAAHVGAADGPDYDREFEEIVAGLRDANSAADDTQPPPSEPPRRPAANPQPVVKQAGGDYDLLRPPAPPAQASAEEPGSVVTVAEVEAPPKLAMPPKPQLKTSRLLEKWANAFPHLIWLSVISGLVGQIYGWTKEFAFAGPVVAVAVAVTLGGTFEFIMVAASSRGLRDIGHDRPLWQCLAFLTVGTACAALAVYMCLHHFIDQLELVGRAAAAATAIGYIAHVMSHLFDELDNQRKMRDYQAECERIKTEIEDRERQARAEYDAYQKKIRDAQLKQFETRIGSAAAAAAQERAEGDVAPSQQARRQRRAAPLPDKPSGKPFKFDDAQRELGDRWWDRLTPAEVNKAMAERGYAPRSKSTIRRWRQEQENLLKTQKGN